MIRLSLFIILISFCGSSTLLALTNAEEVMVRSQLEHAITDRVKGAISTVLDKDTLEVSVSVQVRENKKDKSPLKEFKAKPPSEMNGLPQDMLLGVIDAEPIVRYYTEQYELLKNYRGEEMGGIKTSYDITSINIFVGISEALGTDYATELGRWLDRWAKQSFGNKTKTNVSTIKPKPAATPTPAPQKTWLDIFSSLQQMLGLAILGLCILAGLVLWRLFSSKDESKPMDMPMPMASYPRSAPQASPLEKEQSSELVSRSNKEVSNVEAEAEELKIIQDLSTKIVQLAIEMKVQQKALAELWLSSGKKGFFKLACFFDALMNTNSNFKFEQLSLNYHIKKLILDVYQQMANLPSQNKVKLFKEVYWDLVAAKTLGSETIKQPFGYLENLPETRVKEIVTAQPLEVQVLIAMNMPTRVREKYFSNLDVNQKKTLISQSFNLKEFEYSELEVINETLRAFSDREQSTSSKISAIPLAKKLLNALSAIEEVTILRDITPALQYRGLLLKQTYPSLAFLPEWPKQALAQLCLKAETEELVTLIYVMPEAEQNILTSCPPRMAQIIQDDLGRASRMPTQRQEENLRNLKGKVIEMMNDGQLDLYQIFTADERPELKVAA